MFTSIGDYRTIDAFIGGMISDGETDIFTLRERTYRRFPGVSEGTLCARLTVAMIHYSENPVEPLRYKVQ